MIFFSVSRCVETLRQKTFQPLVEGMLKCVRARTWIPVECPRSLGAEPIIFVVLLSCRVVIIKAPYGLYTDTSFSRCYLFRIMDIFTSVSSFFTWSQSVLSVNRESWC